MEFKKLNAEEIEKLDDAQLKEYTENLEKFNAEKEEALKNKIETLSSKEEVEAVKSELEALKESMKEQGNVIKNLKEEGKMNTTLKSAVGKWLTENHDKIKQIKSQGAGSIEMTFKVVDAMFTGSATNPDGIPELVGVQSAAPTNVNLKGAIVDELLTTFNTSLAAYPYTESVPKDGDYAFVAEKGTKPQIDMKIETRYAEPKKVAAHMVVTDEAVQDIPGLQSIATDYLRRKHDLKRQNGILFGDGVGANLKGATVYGRAFVAGSLALSVDTPNFMDVVNAAVTDIYTTHNFQDEVPYMANIVMVNPADFYLELVSAKDANGLPLYPSAGLFNRVVMGGITIIPFEDIPAGKIFVADMSKYNVTNYVDYTVRIGWINDQLITNQFTIVGESRLHGFVKKLDEQAFIYDDIATIRTAIAKI